MQAGNRERAGALAAAAVDGTPWGEPARERAVSWVGGWTGRSVADRDRARQKRWKEQRQRGWMG